MTDNNTTGATPSQPEKAVQNRGEELYKYGVSQARQLKEASPQHLAERFVEGLLSEGPQIKLPDVIDHPGIKSVLATFGVGDADISAAFKTIRRRDRARAREVSGIIVPPMPRKPRTGAVKSDTPTG